MKLYIRVRIVHFYKKYSVSFALFLAIIGAMAGAVLGYIDMMSPVCREAVFH